MRIAVLGTGNMGRALIGGLVKQYGTGISIFAFDQKSAALEGLDKAVSIAPVDQWFSNDKSPSAVIIAVKPSDMDSAFQACSAAIKTQAAYPLWISIAAGISIGRIQENLGAKARICRVMPNTPALIGEGVSAFAVNNNCSEADSNLVNSIFSACGRTVPVTESLMDAITGLSGSGPAYVYLFIEALIEGGVTAGLPLQIARECAIQTVIGAAKMVDSTNETPAVLRARVMSPGGTTVSGIKALEQYSFREGIIEAVKAATNRSAQLGK